MSHRFGIHQCGRSYFGRVTAIFRDTRCPDFFVIGAQKSGTTMLCEWLDAHPAITLSSCKEPMFFSRDEAAVHRHRFMVDSDAWAQFDWDARRETLLADYARCFSHAEPNALLGDGSTTYLPSIHAPARIRELNPEARIVAILRNPVDRAYSAYWHYLAHGESCQSFEQHLRYESGLTVAMGEYQRQLEHWLGYFPRSQFHILVLEEFRQHQQERFMELLGFLGADHDFSPPNDHNANRARVPRSVWLQVWTNYLYQRGSGSGGGWRVRLRGWVAQRNLVPGRYPPMREQTRRHLTRYYQQANKGLSDLIEINVEDIWFASPSGGSRGRHSPRQ